MAAAVQYTAIDSVSPTPSAAAKKKLSSSASSSSQLQSEAARSVGGTRAAAAGGATLGGAPGACANGTRTVPGKVFWKGRYIDHSLIYQVGSAGQEK